MKTGMWIRRVCLLIAAWPIAGAAAASGGSEADDLVREVRVSYLVEHADKTTERVVVKYEAFLHHKVWETGRVATPLVGRARDDRQCHLTVSPRVFRRAFILTQSGVEAAVDGYQAVYNARQAVGRGGGDQFEARTNYSACGEVDEYRGRVDGARSQLVGLFDELVAQDDDLTREQLRAMLLARRIVPVKGADATARR